MTNRTFLVAWLVVAAMLLGLRPAAAHNPSVLVVRFQELANGRYQLDYPSPPGSPQSEAFPVLPAHGRWEEQPPLPVGPVRLTFGTDGKPLTGDDRILLPWRNHGVMVQAFWRSGEAVRRFLPPGKDGIVMRIGDLRAGTGGTGEAAKRYTLLGMRHILLGWDHLLFLAGLLMLVTGWRRLVATITAFTVAHSLTLALAAFGYARLDKGLVEVLVALSIVFLAVEIAHLRQGRVGLAARRPWVVAFGFGLIHGMGFAEALATLGLLRAELPLALLFFNLGVESGQLLAIALWLALVAAARPLALRLPERFAWVPAYGLGTLAMCWFVDRVLTLFL
jgi:hypothetical protein